MGKYFEFDIPENKDSEVEVKGGFAKKDFETIRKIDFREKVDEIVDKLFPENVEPVSDRIKIKLFLEIINYRQDLCDFIFIKENVDLIREITSLSLVDLALKLNNNK